MAGGERFACAELTMKIETVHFDFHGGTPQRPGRLVHLRINPAL
jgi:hypothetical protein